MFYHFLLKGEKYMSRKFLTLLIFMLMFACILPSALAKEKAPRISEFDHEYVLTWEDQDGFLYVKRSTVKVNKYEPPTYNVSADIVTTDKKKRIIGTTTEYFYYVYDKRKMYHSDDGSWVYLASDDKSPFIAKWRALGEMVFCLANNRHFYGKNAGYKDEFYMPAWKGQKRKK